MKSKKKEPKEKKEKKVKEKKIKEKKKKTTLIYLGRIEEYCKNISMLIKTIARIKSDDFELWIVGDGKDKKMYEEMVSSLNIESKVKFLGQKTNPYPYLKLGDALVLSSVSEGNPMVFIEARKLCL